MSVDVDKLKTSFVNRVEDQYNQDQYFIESCFKNETRYSKRISLIDKSLEIYFTQNNYIDLHGKRCKYCTEDTVRRKVRLACTSDNHLLPIN